jgi:uncharacterized coiled-coil DUF342 family protein
MDPLDTLENKIAETLQKLRALEEQNRQLQEELDQEKENKRKVNQRLDLLLKKIDEADIN